MIPSGSTDKALILLSSIPREVTLLSHIALMGRDTTKESSELRDCEGPGCIMKLEYDILMRSD